MPTKFSRYIVSTFPHSTKQILSNFFYRCWTCLKKINMIALEFICCSWSSSRPAWPSPTEVFTDLPNVPVVQIHWVEQCTRQRKCQLLEISFRHDACTYKYNVHCMLETNFWLLCSSIHVVNQVVDRKNVQLPYGFYTCIWIGWRR